MTALARTLPRLAGAWRGWLTSLLFFGYLLLLQPLVLRRLSAVIERDWADPGLGWLLLGAAFVELAGLALKRPAFSARLRAAARLQAAARPPDGMFLGALWLAHTALAVALAFSGLKALGLDLEAVANGPDGGPVWPEGAEVYAMLVFGAVVLKELALPWALPWVLVSRRADAAERAAAPWRDLAGELLILPFSALGFTLMWEYAAGRSALTAGNPALALLELVGWSLFFLIAYFGARGAYLLEHSLRLNSPTSWTIFALMTGLNLLAALAGLLAA